MIWLVNRAAFGSHDLRRLLDEGWEPFAVAIEPLPNYSQFSNTVVYLRREKTA